MLFLLLKFCVELGFAFLISGFAFSYETKRRTENIIVPISEPLRLSRMLVVYVLVGVFKKIASKLSEIMSRILKALLRAKLT